MLFGEGSYFYKGSVTIFSFILMFSGLIYGIRVGSIDDNRDFVDGMSYYLIVKLENFNGKINIISE